MLTFASRAGTSTSVGGVRGKELDAIYKVAGTVGKGFREVNPILCRSIVDKLTQVRDVGVRCVRKGVGSAVAGRLDTGNLLCGKMTALTC